MIEALANRISLSLQHREIIGNDAREVYAYGLDILLSTLWNTALIVICAVLFRRPLDAAVYIACTYPLRRYGGGWHASTHARCAALSTLTFAAVSWTSYFLYDKITFAILLAMCAVAIAIVLWKAPSQHPDNPIAETSRPKLRKMSIIWTLLSVIAAVVCYVVALHSIAVLIAFSTLSAVGTFLFANKSDEQ